jgi:Mn-dependent DtxR family transcriptional regulator
MPQIGVVMSDSGSETKDKIIQLLRKERREMFTKEIAQKLTMALPTVSKYLGILHAEGQVIKSDERKPYTYWSLKDNGIQ